MTTHNDKGHPLGPALFAKVLVDGKVRLIKVSLEQGGLISGMRVNKDGSQWSRETKEAIQEELVVASSDFVQARYRLNLHYGELEEVNE